MKWLAISVVGLIFAVHWMYIAVVSAAELRDRGQLTTYWKFFVLPGAVFGLALDFAGNVFLGWIPYAEVPLIHLYTEKELLFTARCKRHKSGFGWRKSLADFLCRQLNLFDPGHC